MKKRCLSAGYDLADVALMLPEIIDRTQDRLASRGASPGMVATALGMYHTARSHEFAAVDPLLAELIDRPPIAVCDWLAEHHHAGGL